MAKHDTESQIEKLQRKYASIFFLWLALVVVTLAGMLATSGAIQDVATIGWFVVFPGGAIYFYILKSRLARLSGQ